MKLIAMGLFLALATCDGPTPVTSVCIPLPQYTDQQKADLKALYDAAPSDSPIRWVVGDYLKVRNEAREACPK